MKKNDTIGLGVSVLLHALLLVAFGFLAGATPEPQQLGYIEVDFGPLAEGRPVRRAETPRPDVPTQTPKPVQEQQKKASPPKVSKPVELPKQKVEDPDKIQAPKTETVTPRRQNNPEDAIQPEEKPEQQPVAPAGGGAADGDTGSTEGAQGQGTDAQKSSPYNIEGLRRTILYDPLPGNVANTNATLTFRVVVDPSGRVTQLFPLRKGNPTLEQVTMTALRQWRFNPLPGDAPQVTQEGTITFRFIAR